MNEVLYAIGVGAAILWASLIFFDFSLTVKEVPHECVIRTSQP